MQALLACRAIACCAFPVDDEILCGKALVLTRLPGMISPHGSQQINVVITLAGDDFLDTRVTTIHDMSGG